MYPCQLTCWQCYVETYPCQLMPWHGCGALYPCQLMPWYGCGALYPCQLMPWHGCGALWKHCIVTPSWIIGAITCTHRFNKWSRTDMHCVLPANIKVAVIVFSWKYISIYPICSYLKSDETILICWLPCCTNLFACYNIKHQITVIVQMTVQCQSSPKETQYIFCKYTNYIRVKNMNIFLTFNWYINLSWCIVFANKCLAQ